MPVSCVSLPLFIVLRVPRIIGAMQTISSFCFPYFTYFTYVVQLSCAQWVAPPECSLNGTRFNEAETNFRIAGSLDIPLMNSKC